MLRPLGIALTAAVFTLVLAGFGRAPPAAPTGRYSCSQTVGQSFLPADSQLVLKSRARYSFTANAVNANPAPSKGHYSRAGSKLTFRGGEFARKRATIKHTAAFGTQLVFRSLRGKRCQQELESTGLPGAGAPPRDEEHCFGGGESVLCPSNQDLCRIPELMSLS